jgi:hypothetical protein
MPKRVWLSDDGQVFESVHALRIHEAEGGLDTALKAFDKDDPATADALIKALRPFATHKPRGPRKKA